MNLDPLTKAKLEIYRLEEENKQLRQENGEVFRMYNYDLQKEAKERMKEIVMRMNNLTEEEFLNKYINDIMFHKGFDVLVDLFLSAKFN